MTRTPLGSPVEPDVYWRNATEPGPSAASVNAAAPPSGTVSVAIHASCASSGHTAVSAPAIFGSDLHKLVYSKDYEEFEKHKREIDESDHHAGRSVMDLQQRGEYLYAAMGKGGFRVYDIANIDNKNFSEKMTTAPVSPFGQKFFLKTKNATDIGSPSTLAVDPLRQHLD